MLNIVSHHEMLIKGTMRCHYTPTRVAKIKKTENNKYW